VWLDPPVIDDPPQRSLPFTSPGAAPPPGPASPPGPARPPPEEEPLGAALEAALLRELARVYEVENWARFGDRLTPAVLALGEGTSRLGWWDPATRTIALARALVLEQPWPDVVAVLQHEMAHQFVDEVLRVRDETAHGATFRQVCARLGIDGRAAGTPAGPAGEGAEVDRVLARVRKLLALAGSANQHEAEAAMQRAHALMLRHNLDAAAAAHPRAFEVRHLGDPSRRGTAVEAAIIVLLTDCFFVEAIRVPVYLPRLGKRGAQYELSGTRANLELAVHVHAFLLDTAERLWQARRGDPRVRGGRDRLAFQTGVIRGFHDKLRDERAALAGTGLVWRGDAALADFYHRRHPRIRSSRRRQTVTRAHAAGREAGRQVVLHRPVEGRGTGPRRLLPGGG
jgi:hypothetical protein